MNKNSSTRDHLRRHVAALEAQHPITIIGVLPRGSAAHRVEEDTIDLLAEKRDGLDLFGLASAENALADRIGHPVGIVLRSGLRGREAETFPSIVEPL
jgi:predicted nucleotidyltransferase